MPGFVLIIDDEVLLARNIKTFLNRHGYETETANTIARGLQIFDEAHPDVVLIDHNLPDGTGLSLIKEIRQRDRSTKLIMITAHGGVDLAVAAMKSGADDYLTKPVSLDEIVILIERLMSQARVEGSLSYLRSRAKSQSGLDRILGNSLIELIAKE